MDHPSLISIGSCVWYHHKEYNKELQQHVNFDHVAVVLCVDDSDTETVYGIVWCSKQYYEELKPISVEKKRSDGKALMLDQDRYFYRNNFKYVLTSKISLKYGKCPVDLLSSLRKMVGLEEETI